MQSSTPSEARATEIGPSVAVLGASFGRRSDGFFGWVLGYVLLVVFCLGALVVAGDFDFGRNPWANLWRSAVEMSSPSFLDIWFGNPELTYRSDDGTVLRVENRQELEWSFLGALGRATWVTFQIATLGSALAALVAWPLGMLSANNLQTPRWLRALAKLVLDVSRSIHTLVFGLILVGIVGLGPMAGILAIAAHSLGTYGKLYAESIESLDMAAIDAVRATGADPLQVFTTTIWPTVLPQIIGHHLYVWEFNIRDSTILGLIGAGGLGLLIAEAVSLFQWGRLSTILIVVILLVTCFDTLSKRLRKYLR